MKAFSILTTLLSALLGAGAAQASTLMLTVNTTLNIADANPGDGVCQTPTPDQCTLRAAIEEAVASINFPNAITAAEIHFNIPDTDPGRVSGTDPVSGLSYEYYRIEVAQPLPAIGAANILIDATTQIAVNPLGHPTVLLRGSGTAANQGTGGLRATHSFITIRGFALQGFGRALAITPSGGLADMVRLQRNWVGIPLPGDGGGHGNVEGIVVAPTGGSVVTRSTIGGTTLGDGNWIGGNSAGGVIVYGRSGNNSDNVVSLFNVFGNRIGLNPLGQTALGNGGAGIYIRHAGVTVGGLTAERANVIAGSVPGDLLIQTAPGSPQSIAIEGVGVFWDSGGTGSMAGNLVGTRVAGDQARPNASDGVRILRTAGALSIGSTLPGGANLISGNGGHGIAVVNEPGTVSPGIVIDGNRIGVVNVGTAALPNQGSGIFASEFFTAPPIRVGSADGGNVIAGNLEDGIRIHNMRVSQLEVLGNRIGLGSDGSTAVPNQQYGLVLSQAGATDEPDPAARIEGNTIAANGAGGILVTQPGTSMVLELCSNRIGVAADGVTPRGNQGAGMRLQNAATGSNGGRILQPADCAEANLFAHNAGPGVVMAANATNLIATFSGMRFGDNDLDENALAIDLADDGPTPNDPGDADTGPNRLQNFPDLGAVVLAEDGDTLSVTFRVDNFFPDFHPMMVDFYLDDGQGQGRDHVGTATVLAGEIQQLKTVLLDAEPAWAGRGLVALATDALGHTSEFSRPRVVIDTLPKRTLRTRITSTGGASGKVASAPGGIDCGLGANDCVAAYPEGQNVTLSATPGPGSVFDIWLDGACVGNVPSCELPMSQDRNVTANFIPASSAHTLTVTLDGEGGVNSNPAGIDCPGTCAAAFDHGSTVTLTATPDSGWLFDGWIGCTPTDEPGQCNITLNSAASVTALFVQQATDILVDFSGAGEGSVTSSPAGIDCFSGGPACFGEFDGGDGPVTLTASPDSGSVFFGWSGDCTGTGPCVLGPSGEFQVTARFEPEGALPDEIFADGFEGGGTP
ncbi:MAG TPA: hypothetical protein PKZ76_07590 [Xanthomonadaceae bacterium]|nr:hypothetical protein [Xanthomonadaceae bacterium]